MLKGFKCYINDNFGSKRGLLNSFLYGLKTKLGFYREYEDIDFAQIRRLIFVCSGNICRSPLAEYVAKADGFLAESYGLHCRGGDTADWRAIEIGSNNNLDMRGHTTRNILDYTYRKGDLVVGMELGHIVELIAIVGEAPPKTTAMMWAAKKNIYLHDPFSANEIFFEKCELSLIDAVKRLVVCAKNIR